MNLKTIYNKITGDIRAVSPVVATLVLIVVAIIGAAAVGAMTGAFTQDVGREEADVGIAGGSLIIAGSSTVYPVGVELARGFMAAHQGTRVTVQGGGSGAGISAVGRNVIDIGMSSRIGGINEAETAAFPILVNRVVHIGNSTVLLVGHIDINQTELNNITAAELRTLFRDGHAINISRRDATTGVIIPGAFRTLRGVFRADRSGTADEFAKMIGTGATEDGIRTTAAAHPANITLRRYNSGVFEAIRTTENRIGGIDIGFADARVRQTTYVGQTRDRPLNMITHGAPSRLEKAFLDYARSPGAIRHFTAVGVRSLHCDAPVFSATR